MRIENGVQKQDEKITYSDYKKRLAMNKRQNIMMFTSILLVFLGVARIMSPDIDITLGDENSQQIQQEEEYGRGIDSRLKDLQKEDEMSESNPDAQTEEDGLVKIPKHEDKSVSATNDDETTVSKGPEDDVKKTETQAAPKPEPVAPVTTKTYRVYVGSYSTHEQAEVARGILQEAGLGVSPNIKSVGSTYTLQVGAFSSQESAQNLSNNLLMHNYPARVVSD